MGPSDLMSGGQQQSFRGFVGRYSEGARTTNQGTGTGRSGAGVAGAVSTPSEARDSGAREPGAWEPGAWEPGAWERKGHRPGPGRRRPRAAARHAAASPRRGPAGARLGPGHRLPEPLRRAVRADRCLAERCQHKTSARRAGMSSAVPPSVVARREVDRARSLTARRSRDRHPPRGLRQPPGGASSRDVADLWVRLRLRRSRACSPGCAVAPLSRSPCGGPPAVAGSVGR
jgi:hypothetical protein